MMLSAPSLSTPAGAVHCRIGPAGRLPVVAHAVEIGVAVGEWIQAALDLFAVQT
jgi:hypothetical protein